MKKQIIPSIIAICFVVLFAVVSVSAQVNGQVAADIPFDFYIKNQKFAAGKYIIEKSSPNSLSGSLVIRQKDGGNSRMVMTLPLALNGKSIEAPPSLIFNRYGSDYFLSEFRNPADSFGARVPQVKLERNLAKQTGEAKRETVVLTSIQR